MAVTPVTESTINLANDRNPSSFSPCDRDICANPPFGVGLVLDGAGQVRATGTDGHILPPDVIFMHQDYNEDDYNLQIMFEIEEENDLLEIAEQRQHEYESLQMRDDIIRQMNAETEQIIAAFESLEHGDNDNSEFYDRVDEVTAAFYLPRSLSLSDDLNENNITEDDAENMFQLDSFSDDLNENTDTEDGAEEMIDLIKANSDGTKHIMDLINANMKLLEFLSRQGTTITRLCSRIGRLGEMVQQLTLELETIQNNNRQGSSSCVTDEAPTDPMNLVLPACIRSKGLVLVDTIPDMTLSTLNLKFNPKGHLGFLINPKIHREIKKKQEQLLAPQDSTASQLWIYFDSLACRSVISTTSPIRQHLLQAQPVHGSCSIGDGTPLEYIEKGVFNSVIDTTVVKNLKYDLFSSVNH